MTLHRSAVVLMAYGTPRTPDEILPYYTDIRRGRPPTDEQLAESHRPLRGDRWAASCRRWPPAPRPSARRCSGARRGRPGTYHVVLGLKHAVAEDRDRGRQDVAADGFRRIVGLVLAPHYSAFSVGQYLDRLRAAAAAARHRGRGIDSWATEPAFVEFLAADLRAKLAAMPAGST
jgi:ferrochelatase